MSLEMVGRVSAGDDLNQSEMADVVDQLMRGQWPDEQVAVFLTALHHKGETVDELAGAAEALRRHMTPIRSRHTQLLDTCGTGGDGSGTFNISTAAAIVAAAAGVPVAKHGNRAMTSRTGSADVLAELGVDIGATVSQAEACLNEVGICFCFAQLLHPAMKHVSAVRRQLGIRTIFNLLGPLCNPANATWQLLGVGRPELRGIMAQALAQLGTQRALVVAGQDGLDEVTLTGPTDCTEVHANRLRTFIWSPTDFDLTEVADLSPLRVEDARASAAVIQDVLNNRPGPSRDVVVLNAAAALWIAGRGNPRECSQQAVDAIGSGAARNLLARWTEFSQSTR